MTSSKGSSQVAVCDADRGRDRRNQEIARRAWVIGRYRPPRGLSIERTRS